MYTKKDDVDVYRVRSYKWPIAASGASEEADVDVITHRLGTVRQDAHYDPLGGFRGLEWTFEDTKGEPFMFFQQYGTWYVSNRYGGIELMQFRDWVVGRLSGTAEPPTVALGVSTPNVEAAVSTPVLEEEYEDGYDDDYEEDSMYGTYPVRGVD